MLEPDCFRAYSSVGQSARLISVRSVVQIYLGPPGQAGHGPEHFGAVAQLGEHRLCKPGVVGSIPISSTIGFGDFSSQASLEDAPPATGGDVISGL